MDPSSEAAPMQILSTTLHGFRSTDTPTPITYLSQFLIDDDWRPSYKTERLIHHIFTQNVVLLRSYYEATLFRQYVLHGREFTGLVVLIKDHNSTREDLRAAYLSLSQVVVNLKCYEETFSHPFLPSPSPPRDSSHHHVSAAGDPYPPPPANRQSTQSQAPYPPPPPQYPLPESSYRRQIPPQVDTRGGGGPSRAGVGPSPPRASGYRAHPYAPPANRRSSQVPLPLSQPQEVYPLPPQSEAIYPPPPLQAEPVYVQVQPPRAQALPAQPLQPLAPPRLFYIPGRQRQQSEPALPFYQQQLQLNQQGQNHVPVNQLSRVPNFNAPSDDQMNNLLLNNEFAPELPAALVVPQVNPQPPNPQPPLNQGYYFQAGPGGNNNIP